MRHKRLKSWDMWYWWLKEPNQNSNFFGKKEFIIGQIILLNILFLVLINCYDLNMSIVLTLSLTLYVAHYLTVCLRGCVDPVRTQYRWRRARHTDVAR